MLKSVFNMAGFAERKGVAPIEISQAVSMTRGIWKEFLEHSDKGVDKLRLLKREEEVGLFMVYERGVLANQIILQRGEDVVKLTLSQDGDLHALLDRTLRTRGMAAIKRLPSEKLWIYVEEAQMARECLVRFNQGLVFSGAHRYDRFNVEFDDLFQEGQFGLLRAIDKFDYRLGNKFSTMAVNWIRQGVGRAVLNQDDTMRKPIHFGEDVRKVKKFQSLLHQQLGRDPEEIEIAEHWLREIELKKKLPLGRLDHKLPSFLKRVRRTIEDDRKTVSWEGLIGKGEAELGDLIEDQEAAEKFDEGWRALAQDQIEEILDRMDPKDAYVLRLRFGLGQGEDGGYGMSLKELAEALGGVTRERARVLSGRAITRFKEKFTWKKTWGDF